MSKVGLGGINHERISFTALEAFEQTTTLAFLFHTMPNIAEHGALIAAFGCPLRLDVTDDRLREKTDDTDDGLPGVASEEG